jgi:hypothetical protein
MSNIYQFLQWLHGKVDLNLLGCLIFGLILVYAFADELNGV